MLALILAISDPIKRDLLLDLFQNHKGKCVIIAFHIVRNQQDAEDIVQDVIEKIIKDTDMLKYDTVQENWPYIAIMIKNASLNYLRKNAKIVLVDNFDNNEEGVPPIAYNDVDFAELLSSQERYVKVVTAIMALPEIYKDAILLRYGNGLSNKDISAVLGISIENVWQRISRAIKMLEKELKEQDSGDENGK